MDPHVHAGSRIYHTRTWKGDSQSFAVRASGSATVRELRRGGQGWTLISAGGTLQRMAELIIQSGKHQGKRLTVPASTIVIGRDETCRIRLASSDVSRQHCALRSTPEGILVRDLGSRNGTLINETPIERETLLNPGDMLRVGPMLFSAPAPTKEPAVKVARPANSQSTTDDDIAGWLSGDEEDGPADGSLAAGETTIITNLPPKPRSGPAPRDFKSLAEEAAWVIRKHWEEVRRKDDEQSQ